MGKCRHRAIGCTKFCTYHLDSMTDIKELDSMDAKEQWAKEPAQAKSLAVFWRKVIIQLFSLFSTDFQVAWHYILSGLWRKALRKRLHVVSNWKRHSAAFPLSLNQCGYSPIVIKSSVSEKLPSSSTLSPEFQGFDDKLGILNFTDPNQCWTQKKAQCPMVIQEHDYFWTEIT